MVENAATSSRSTVAVAVAAAVAVAGAAVVVAGGTAAAAEGIAPYCATLKGIFSNLRWEVLWTKKQLPSEPLSGTRDQHCQSSYLRTKHRIRDAA